MKLSALPVLTAAASFALLLTACHRSQGGGGPPMMPAAVTMNVVEEKPVVEWQEFTGRVAAVETVELRPRIAGMVQEVRFQAGSIVAKDAVLFVLDKEPLLAKTEMARSELKRAEAAAFSAQREFDRAPALLAAKAISPEQSEGRESLHLQAQAALAAARAALRSTEIDLGYCEVTAPIAGRVSRALVTAGNTVSQSTQLTTLVSVDPMHVYAAVDESSLLKYQALARAGKTLKDDKGRVPVELQLSGEDGFPHRGWVESLDNRLDPATGSMAVRAEFSNADGLLTPGLFARIRLPMTGRYSAPAIDPTAVRTDLGRSYVMMVDEKSLAQYRSVVLGPIIDGRRIIREGLKAGEKIIVNGGARVHQPGQPVTPAEPAAPNAAAAAAKS